MQDTKEYTKEELARVATEACKEALRACGIHGPVSVELSPSFSLNRVSVELEIQSRHEKPMGAMAILCEEVGEAVQRAYTENMELLREEIVQVAAMALAILVMIDRKEGA